MRRHTIVIELLDDVEHSTPNVEQAITDAVERTGIAKVVQYHHEQIPEDPSEA